MALTLSQCQAISKDVWMPNSYNNWLMGNVMMHKLLKNVDKIGSGEYVRFVLLYAKNRGGAMSGSTIFDTAKKTFLNAARFPWAYFYSNFTYDIEDQVQINGEEAEIDYILQGLDNCQDTIRDDMGISMWQAYSTSAGTTWDASTKPFWGIADMMSQTDTSPYYGLIQKADLGTYTREGTSVNIWQCYENSNALTMNFATMQTLRRNCIVGEGPASMPDLYITTPTLYDKLENSIEASKRYYDDDLAKLGFDGLKLGARGTITWDNKCTSGYVNGFNFDRGLGLKAHKDYFFAGPEWKQPTNQAVKTTQIIFSGAFGTGERRANGRLTSVS